MKVNDHTAPTAQAIAKSIVQLVERTDGPILLSQIEREIVGFAGQQPLSFSYAVDSSEGEMLIWDGMTEAGAKALRNILRGHRVALQFVKLPLYLVEGRLINSDSWWPAVLLPAKAANVKARRWLLRASPGYQAYAAERAAKDGAPAYQRLVAGPVRFTADQFAAV